MVTEWNGVPCKIWEGDTFPNGYGRLYRDGKTLLAHRVAYEEANGPIPDGLFVLHHCDNPPCIEVSHLFLGTNQDNARDMVEKGRNWQAKVTHCPHGHPYDDANTFIDAQGKRHCLACQRNRGAKWYATRGKQLRMRGKSDEGDS